MVKCYRFQSRSWPADFTCLRLGEARSAVSADLPQVYAPPLRDMLIVRLDSKLVGCVMVCELDVSACDMKHLFVSAGAQRLGVGRRLCEVAHDPVSTARDTR
jgi:predicted N-acetyltransferase YhbS